MEMIASDTEAIADTEATASVMEGAEAGKNTILK
jgi:hypothetical protein